MAHFFITGVFCITRILALLASLLPQWRRSKYPKIFAGLQMQNKHGNAEHEGSTGAVEKDRGEVFLPLFSR